MSHERPGRSGDAVGLGPELLAALRCARLAPGLATLWRFSRRDGRELLARVDDVVMPIVERTVSDPAEREWIRGAFYTAAVKFGIGIWGYTRMAGRPVSLRLIALSTAFTRLYDDLIDHGSDAGLDARFDRLLAGERPAPLSELEWLMQELFLELETLVAPQRSDAFYDDFAVVHAWQRRSRAQRASGTAAPEDIWLITQGKGACGIRLLYTLGHKLVPAEERALIEQIGVVGQMLDDLHDLPADTRDGMRTPVTLGHVTAGRTGREVIGLARRLRRAFGSRAARPFGGLLFLYQAGLVRRRTAPPAHARPIATTPLRILLGPTRDISPDQADFGRPPRLPHAEAKPKAPRP